MLLKVKTEQSLMVIIASNVLQVVLLALFSIIFSSVIHVSRVMALTVHLANVINAKIHAKIV